MLEEAAITEHATALARPSHFQSLRPDNECDLESLFCASDFKIPALQVPFKGALQSNASSETMSTMAAYPGRASPELGCLHPLLM